MFAPPNQLSSADAGPRKRSQLSYRHTVTSHYDAFAMLDPAKYLSPVIAEVADRD